MIVSRQHLCKCHGKDKKDALGNCFAASLFDCDASCLDGLTLPIPLGHGVRCVSLGDLFRLVGTTRF